jgi:light-regulated signal transduction histidine kinase (bacteriophytochrome)
MEYKDFFSPKTLEKLNKKSAENLKTMLGDKNLMQTIMSSQQLLPQISKAEAPYKSQLEKLAVDMVKELYPIIDEEGIVLDAKIGIVYLM